jgi:nitroreductase
MKGLKDMDAIEAIRKRCSVREFKETPIPKELVITGIHFQVKALRLSG